MLEPALIDVLTELRRLAGYAARREISIILDTLKHDRKRLEHYGYKIYSQNGEDGIIEEIFRRLGMDNPGTFVEIGVQVGLECNSFFLLHKGWRGTWIEADSKSVQFMRQKFASLIKAGRLTIINSLVTPGNINDTVTMAELDFISIDVDGMDIHLLAALLARPKVICVEFNSKFPPPLERVPVYDANYHWSGTDFMGSSLTSINKVATAKGYTLVGCDVCGVNAFFVRNDLVGDRFSLKAEQDGGPERLYNPPRYWLTSDGYNIGHRPDFGPYEGMG